MAIVYSYPTATPEAQDLLVGTEMAAQGGEDAPKTRTFTIGSIASFVTTNNTVTNTTSSALSLATLNSAYPLATIGFKVQCSNVAVLKIYEKASIGWVSYSITNVV
jgi:hypothetical protein